jgi:molybdopterin molybdotransferase
MIDPCCLDAKPLLTLEAALDKIHATLRPIHGSETIALQDALGRVLDVPVYSPINLPQDRNSAMDGYAFCSKDSVSGQGFTLTLAGTAWAGRPFQKPLQAGQCVRIFTGAVVPPLADSVVIQEQVHADGAVINFPVTTQSYQNIREVGEDVSTGSLLCPSPKKLTVFDLGLLASVGINELTVKRPLKITLFSTGDELIQIDQTLAAGKIYDSNRYLLRGLLTDAGYRVFDGGILADNKQQMQAALLQAAETADVIITTGGASVGEADYIEEILARCGEVTLWKIAVKPGKPLAFGQLGGCCFFGLPGNPVAVVVTFQQIVAPALRQLSGAPAVKPLRLTATCTTPLKKSPGRQEFQRGVLIKNDSNEFFVASAGRQGSHILSSMSQSNCFIILPTECQGVQTGETVTVEPFTLFI